MMKSAANGSSTGGSLSDPITILIVDDERTFGEALEVALDREDDLQILEVATDGADAIRLVRERQPDVVIMDVSMPGMNGIEATRRILMGDPATIVVLLSTHQVADLPPDLLQCGAAGFLRKEALNPTALELLVNGARPPAHRR